MNSIAFWGGLAAMLFASVFIRRGVVGHWIYCGGMAVVIVSMATDTSVSTFGRWASSVTLTIVLVIYAAAFQWRLHLREEDHACEEVDEGQVDGGGPEEAQDREDV